MVNRVSATSLQVRQYFRRYTEDALDICDVLGSYAPGGKVKLDEVSKILGLTGKPEGIDGSRVEEMVQAGQIEEVARYCESDVLNTYRVLIQLASDPSVERKKKPSSLAGYWIAEIHPNVCAWIERDEPTFRKAKS